MLGNTGSEIIKRPHCLLQANGKETPKSRRTQPSSGPSWEHPLVGVVTEGRGIQTRQHCRMIDASFIGRCNLHQWSLAVYPRFEKRLLPLAPRGREDQRQVGRVREPWLSSHCGTTLSPPQNRKAESRPSTVF
jgi:hypothetical protein